MGASAPAARAWSPAATRRRRSKEPARTSLDAADRDPDGAYGAKDIRSPASDDHYRDWLEAIIARGPDRPGGPVGPQRRGLRGSVDRHEAAAELTSDPAKEVFFDDDAAERDALAQTALGGLDVNAIMKKGGLG